MLRSKSSPDGKPTTFANQAPFGLLCILLVFAAWGISVQLVPHAAEALSTPPDPGVEKAISAMLELAKLLISWSLAVVAGAAFLVKISTDTKIPLRPFHLLLIELSALLALLSLLLGCQAISNAILVLNLHQSPVGNTIVDPYVGWQYRVLVASALTLIIAAHAVFWHQHLAAGVPSAAPVSTTSSV